MNPNKPVIKLMFPHDQPQPRTREEQLAADLQTLLQRQSALEETPIIYAAIAGLDRDRITIATGQQMLSVLKPKAMAGLEPGAMVRMLGGQTPMIIDVVDEPPVLGQIAEVKKVLDEGRLIEINDRLVFAHKKLGKVKPGDRVALDHTHRIALRNLGTRDPSKALSQDTGVTWESVGGQATAKQALIEAIEEPVLHREVYERFGRRPVRGVLLWGPPGCGKTLLGKACASALARVHGDAAKGGFIYVKGPEILNMWVGESEANVRKLFARAREHKALTGVPAVVFIDEADAIMNARSNQRSASGMESTIVPQFLAEMDGLEDAGAFVLLATNRPDALDGAIVRDGRIDRKVEVTRPTSEDCASIFALNLKRAPTSVPDLAGQATKRLFDDRHALFVVRTKSGDDKRFALRELVSGALIAGLVDAATQSAIRRALKTGSNETLGLADIEAAIVEKRDEQRGLDHSEALREFCRGLDVVRVERA